MKPTENTFNYEKLMLRSDILNMQNLPLLFISRQCVPMRYRQSMQKTWFFPHVWDNNTMLKFTSTERWNNSMKLFSMKPMETIQVFLISIGHTTFWTGFETNVCLKYKQIYHHCSVITILSFYCLVNSTVLVSHSVLHNVLGRMK